ncbi:MAG: SMP-30/gluconolactonase/LRE family protein, partial [Actinomycetota bacterium]|nr:SMP-30/gluconolactonase/LRE family protein [Actinomycetota bacterium]
MSTAAYRSKERAVMAGPPLQLVAELAFDAHAEVGEGPTWDPFRQQLLWVDIPHGAIHGFDPVNGNDHVL